MYKEKLIEQINFFEEKQKQCDNTEDIIKLGNAICDLSCRTDLAENLSKMREQFNSQTKSKAIDVGLKFDTENFADKFEKLNTEFSKQIEEDNKLNWIRVIYLLGLM